MATNKSGIALCSASLVIALMAFVPSAAAFTPAIFLSFGAMAGAVIGAAQGALRTAILTLLVVICTIIVSPLSPAEPWFSSVRAEHWMVGMALSWLVLAGVLLSDYFIRQGAGARKQ